MSLAQLKKLLESIPGFSKKVAYRAFPKERAPKLPFICYMETNSDNFFADNKVYKKITNIDIELYTKLKDSETESLIEETLNNNNIGWEKMEDYIESESCYMITYEIQV